MAALIPGRLPQCSVNTTGPATAAWWWLPFFARSSRARRYSSSVIGRKAGDIRPSRVGGCSSALTAHARNPPTGRASSRQRRAHHAASSPSSWRVSSSCLRQVSQTSSSGSLCAGGLMAQRRGVSALRSSARQRTRTYATDAGSEPGGKSMSDAGSGGSTGVRTTPGTIGTGKSRYRTIEQQKARYRSGPFSWKAGLVFIVTGIGLIMYFRAERARMERKRIAEATKGIGKPKVGGSFDLVDHDGRPFTDEDMKGKYALVYFGFTHCPDICPEELDKMAKMIDLVNQKTSSIRSSLTGGSSSGSSSSSGSVLRPIFITCDPKRDSPAVVKSYLREFHPALIGLTGTYDNIKATCKAYRVYFSTPENVKPGQDYLVDHSIYFYLMDPEGDFVECIGRQHSAEEGAKLIVDHIKDWKGHLDRS